MYVSVVQILMELPDHFFLRITVLELIGVHSVLPDLTTRILGRSLVNVGAAPREPTVQAVLQVLHR